MHIALKPYQELYLLEGLVGALPLHLCQKSVDEVSAVFAPVGVLLVVFLMLIDHPLKEALGLLLERPDLFDNKIY